MKLIQICASQNDLFGLDDDGAVHHYNFNTSSWVALGCGRGQPGGSLPGHDGDAPADGAAWQLPAAGDRADRHEEPRMTSGTTLAASAGASAERNVEPRRPTRGGETP